jgi:hypothetical protein
MAKPPSHRVFVVADPRHDDAKAQWTEVGAIWPHTDNKGFDVIIVNQLSVAGRLVCRQIEAVADRPSGQQPAQRRDRGRQNNHD